MLVVKRMDALYVTFAVVFFSTNIYGEIIHHRPESIFPQDYDKYEPPTKDGEPAAIYVSIVVLDVDSIDEAKMEYSIQIHFAELWKDERLNLSSYLTDYKEPRIFAPYLAEHIWIPDLIFDNSRDGKLFDLTLPCVVIKVMQDGSFLKDSRYNLISSCPMNLQFYPMDVQNCVFDIASLSFTDKRLLLYWIDEHSNYSHVPRILVPYKIKPLKYELTNIIPSKFMEMWYEGNFTFLRAKFIFTRRLTGAIFNVYIPSTLVVLLSWISFWVDVEAVPARVTLGVTSLLTLTTQIVQVHSSLPPISYLTAMDIWLFACLIGVFSVLVEFAFAYQFCLFSKKQSSVNATSKDGEIVKPEFRILKARIDKKTQLQSSDVPTMNRIGLDYFRGNKNLDKISRKLFPILFLCFCLVYWIYFLSYKYDSSDAEEEVTNALVNKLGDV